MARQLLEPILDNGVPNPFYFEGRLLTATAMREDQDAHRARQRHLGRALGAGVVEGLWVGVESVGSPTSAPLMSVGRGLAINGNGQSLELPAREVVALGIESTPAADDAGLFHTCTPPIRRVEGTGDGFYLLVLSPASGFRGRAPASGLAPPRAGGGCGSRWAVEGVRLRLVPFDPLAVTGLAGATRDLLRDELLGSTGGAALSRLRNVVAHLCLGTEPLAAFAADPFLREALAGGGTEPALADYGVTGDLRAAGELTDCDVPLALIHLRVGGLVFVDNWAVRRRPAPPATSAPWPTLSGGRRRAEAEAVLFQFQNQVAELVERSATPTSIRARDHFRWLPPAALVPVAGGGRRGVSRPAFVAGLTTRQPEQYLDGARVGELLALSLDHPPIEPAGGEFVWTYRVRQNHRVPAEGGTDFPYLLLASGHLPYVGTARFDVARWDRSNFGIL